MRVQTAELQCRVSAMYRESDAVEAEISDQGSHD
jgi:hypothetical protein